MEAGHVLAGETVLPLKVVLDDQDITHGHANVFVAQEFFHGGKTHPETQHFGRIGVAQIMF